MIGPFPALLLILSFVAVFFYPITRERHEEIRLEIAARNKAIRESTRNNIDETTTAETP